MVVADVVVFCVEDLRLVFWGVGGRRWRTGRPARTMLCCEASLQLSRHLKRAQAKVDCCSEEGAAVAASDVEFGLLVPVFCRYSCQVHHRGAYLGKVLFLVCLT